MNDMDIEDTRQPPDMEEAMSCDECGEEMEYDKWGNWVEKYMKCTNPFCPKKHIGINKEMAIRIVELVHDNHILMGQNKYLLWREKTMVEHLKMEGKKIVNDTVSQ